MKQARGADHVETAQSMMNLATHYLGQSRHDEAESLLLAALAIYRRQLGDEDPTTLMAMNGLAIAYRRQGRHAESEQVSLQVLATQSRVLGEQHLHTLGSTTNLGNLYLATRRYEDAARMYETSLPIKRRVLGLQHPWTEFALRGLATAYTQLGRHDEARLLEEERLLAVQLQAASRIRADADAVHDAAQTLLAHPREDLRDPARALPLARRACALEAAGAGSRLWIYLDTLAQAEHRTGDTAAAVATLRRAQSVVPADGDRQQAAGIATRLAEFEAALAPR